MFLVCHEFTHTHAHYTSDQGFPHEWVHSYRAGHINDSNLSTCPTWLLLIPSTSSSFLLLIVIIIVVILLVSPLIFLASRVLLRRHLLCLLIYASLSFHCVFQREETLRQFHKLQLQKTSRPQSESTINHRYMDRVSSLKWHLPTKMSCHNRHCTSNLNVLKWPLKKCKETHGPYMQNILTLVITINKLHIDQLSLILSQGFPPICPLCLCHIWTTLQSSIV